MHLPTGKAGALHYVKRARTKDAKPSVEVLNRLAQALDISPDYLLNGTLEDKANKTITDDELLSQFKKVEKLPNDKKKLIKPEFGIRVMNSKCL